MQRPEIDEAMALMRMEYLEMPELKLTMHQAKLAVESAGRRL
jgi:hypothetical protein